MQLTISKPSKVLNSATLPIMIFVCAVWAVFAFMPKSIFVWEGWQMEIGLDWTSHLRPAILAVLSGHNPYSVPYFVSPPWVIPLLLPLAVLPQRLGLAVMLAGNAALFVLVARKLGASWVAVAAILLSPPVIMTILAGNIDGLTALGLILPPPVGMFFIMLKPQSAALVGLYWLVEAWRVGGVRRVAAVFMPFLLVLALSAVILGPWPMQFAKVTGGAGNFSPFPQFIVFGMVLLYKAIKDRKPNLALVASPFFSPYLHVLSFSVPILGFIPFGAGAVICSTIGLWLGDIIQRLV